MLKVGTYCQILTDRAFYARCLILGVSGEKVSVQYYNSGHTRTDMIPLSSIVSCVSFRD